MSFWNISRQNGDSGDDAAPVFKSGWRLYILMKGLLSKLNNSDILSRLFLTGFFLFVFETVLFDSLLRDVEWLSLFYKLLRITSYLLIVFKGAVDFVLKKYSVAEIIGFAAAGLLLLLVARYSGYKDFLIYLAFIAAGHDVEYRRIIKTALSAHLLALVIIFLFCAAGIVPNAKNIRYKKNGVRLIREGLGFRYGGLLAHFVFYTVCLWIYDRKERISAAEIIFLIALNTFIYIKTDTKNPCFLCYAALAGSVILKYFAVMRRFNKAYTLLAVILVPAAVLATLWLAYYYSPNDHLMSVLDGVLNHRLSLWHEAFQRYPVTWFGQRVEYILDATKGYFYIDSSFIKILFNYGIAALVCFAGGMHLLSLRLCRCKDTWLLLVLGLICVHSMFDDQLPWIGSNSFMVCYSYFKVAGNEVKDRIEDNTRK